MIQINVQVNLPPAADITDTRVVYCKHCGKAVHIPRERPDHVLGYLCSMECYIENKIHYDDRVG